MNVALYSLHIIFGIADSPRYCWRVSHNIRFHCTSGLYHFSCIGVLISHMTASSLTAANVTKKSIKNLYAEQRSFEPRRRRGIACVAAHRMRLPARKACAAAHRMQLPAHKARWQLVVYAASAADLHAPYGRGQKSLAFLPCYY